jgi:hypothetical protein
MPAVGIVAAVALAEAGVTATAVGGALLGAEAASAAIIGSTTVGQVVGGAIIGAGTGALSAAVQGGDIGQGMLVGGITGGVGSAVSGAIGTMLEDATVGVYGPELKPTLGGSTALGSALQKGITGAVTGGLGAGLTGGDIGKGILLGGVGGGLTGGLSEGLGLSGTESKILGGALSYGLGQAFAPDAPTRNAVAASPGATTYSQPTITGKTAATQSTAPLGGALLASPTLGYTPGSSFLGGTDSSKPSQNVWNQASLKEGAQVGPGSDGSQAQSS